MNYEVATHTTREAFQSHLDALPAWKTLHSFQWDAPHIVAVYQWATQPASSPASKQ